VSVILQRLRRVRAAAAILPVALGVTLGVFAAPASAASSLGTANFCQTSSGNLCLNDWNGSNQAVKMYQGGVGNEDFVAENVPGRCGGGKVTSNCPFANTAFDSRYAGFPIVQLVYVPGGKCVGTQSATNSSAYLGGCNSTSSGDGGADGTIFVDHDGYLINLFWTNKGQFGDNAACMSGGTSNGGSITLDLATSSGCPKWAVGLSSVVSFAQAIENGYPETGWRGGDVPYIWGGGHEGTPGPSVTDSNGAAGVGLDCSGFSRWVYDLAYGSDVLGSGSTVNQDEEMTRVSSPVPGDLVFFGPSLSSSVHVGVYIGNNQMIDEPAPGDVVRTDTISSAFGNILGYFEK
jgi:hypothetical protein